MNTAFSYGRVSPFDKRKGAAIDSNTIDNQEREARAFYERTLKPKGVAWGGYVSDPGLSAFRRRFLFRPGGAQVDAMLQNGDHIIFQKVDRVFRNLLDFSLTMDHWDRKKVQCHFVVQDIDHTTPMGRACLQMAAVFAQLESGMQSERRKAVNAYLKSEGRTYNGRPPRGFKNHNGMLVPDRREQEALRQLVLFRETCEQCGYVEQSMANGKRFVVCSACGARKPSWERVGLLFYDWLENSGINRKMARPFRLYDRQHVIKLYKKAKALEGQPT